jgi:D-amino-acid dehydrogenase
MARRRGGFQWRRFVYWDAMNAAVNQTPVAVVGAGIVGLACAWHLAEAGLSVTVVDRDPAGDKTSYGNAGGIATAEIVPASVPGLIWKVPGWLIDPLGPLAIRPGHAPRLIPWLWRFMGASRPSEVQRCTAALAALNTRVYDDLLPMLQGAGLAGELHQRGALFVYESQAALDAEAHDWRMRREFGIAHEMLGGDAARALEPALGARIACAVRTPGWSHVGDPKRLTEGLRQALAARGVTFVTGEVERVTPDGQIQCRGGETVRAERVVIAAGAWSGALVAGLGDRVSLESERGYNLTLPNPGVALDGMVIFAERKFVATPLDCGLRIGGAAEFGGLDAKPNYDRSMRLATLAERYLPGLNVTDGKPWCGHRPATPDSLPVIGASPRHANIVYAFGHGHLGLTQSATTGRLVSDILLGRAAPIDLSPYSISRFE